jgi:hypothetical protein
MSIVKKLEIVCPGTKELACLLEGNAMLLLVGKALGTVPADLQRDTISQ